MPACTCAHLRREHRGGSGRCLRPACTCLYGPVPVKKIPMPEPRTRAQHTVNERGEVVDFSKEPSDTKRLEQMLWNRIVEAGLPLPETQHLWAMPERRFRSDFAYPAPEHRILIEVQGGIWAPNPGRHNRGSGYQADLERSNLAQQLGWRLLAFTEKMIRSGEAIDTIRRALEQRTSEVQLSLTGGQR